MFHTTTGRYTGAVNSRATAADSWHYNTKCFLVSTTCAILEIIPPFSARRIAELVGASCFEDVFGNLLPRDFDLGLVLTMSQLSNSTLEKTILVSD